MISFFETIIEILSVPLEKWDELRVRYKIIFFVAVLICMASIVILLN